MLNSLSNNKILTQSKLKAFANDEIKVAKAMNFVFDRFESTAEKGKKAGYQHFILFTQCFKKASYSRSLKVVKGIVWDRFLNSLPHNPMF